MHQSVMIILPQATNSAPYGLCHFDMATGMEKLQNHNYTIYAQWKKFSALVEFEYMAYEHR